MDVDKYLRELYEEMKRIDQTIERLEELEHTVSAPVKRRGRRSMSVEERLTVSRRMTAYWANRREQK